MRALISTVAVIAAAATWYLLDVSDAVAQQPVKPPSIGKQMRSCCGRRLDDPVSVARGVGPIRADKWGF
jgi:hypothetical protein